MSRTVAPPPTDKAMWRRLLARAHPDGGGDHELFIWTRALGEYVGGSVNTVHSVHTDPPEDEEKRVRFEPGGGIRRQLEQALRIAHTAGSPYRYLLEMLADCKYQHRLDQEYRRGASYKRLAAIGHKAGFSKPERVEWYRIAESIPLSDAHARHILDKFQATKESC